MCRLNTFWLWRRAISLALIFALVFSPEFSYAQSAFVSTLPEPGAMIGTSTAFTPVLVKGLVVHPDSPLDFDIIVDSGNDSSDPSVVKEQSRRMVQYFLAAITVPEEQLWVNLSPYEKERIVEKDLGQTVLGRDMLAQDYILKQLTSSLIYPEKGLGKEFWARVYAEAKTNFGTTDIAQGATVDTFNKVWIIPGKAEVFEKGNSVYVTEGRLKVMLDSDHTAMIRNASDSVADEKAAVAKNVMREIVLPAIEKEVNEGKNFAVMRQVYHAVILAKWYRELVSNTLLADMYAGKNKVAGVTSDETALKTEIYQRYIAAYKKGVFNYIKEEADAVTGKFLPRRYFSGGENLRIRDLGRDRDPGNRLYFVGHGFSGAVKLFFSSDPKDPVDTQIPEGFIRLRRLAARHPEQARPLAVLAKHLWDIHPRKRTHVVNVVENYYRFAARDFFPLYQILSPAVRRTVTFEEYAAELDGFWQLYQALPEREKRLFPLLVIFHDIGAREGVRDWLHNRIGARMIPELLSERFGLSAEDIVRLQMLVYFHSATIFWGVDFLPTDFKLLSAGQRTLLQIFILLDMISRQDGRNLASPELIAILKARHMNLRDQEADGQRFVDYRISMAFSYRAVNSEERAQRLARVNEYLFARGVHWYKNFVKNVARMRVYCPDVFLDLSVVSLKIYAELLAQINDEISRQAENQEFEEIVVDTDVNFMGLAPAHSGSAERFEILSRLYHWIRGGHPVLFSARVKTGKLHLTIVTRAMRKMDALRGSQGGGDDAMTSNPRSESDSAVGGIDVRGVQITHRSDGLKGDFNDAAMSEVLNDSFFGFTPVIMNVTPIQSPFMLPG